MQGSHMLRFIPKLIFEEDNKLLTENPTMDEIKQVVFSMQVDSEHGPDGYTAGFYSIYWDVMIYMNISSIKGLHMVHFFYSGPNP